MKYLIVLILFAFIVMALFGSGLFILNFFGLMYDDITGTHDYFMWSFS